MNGVELEDGEVLPADCVVVGAGVLPNTRFVEGLSLEPWIWKETAFSSPFETPGMKKNKENRGKTKKNSTKINIPKHS